MSATESRKEAEPLESGTKFAARINLSHGSGGKDMRDLIEGCFVKTFASPQLEAMEDQARLDLAGMLALGDRLAFTTDSFVVDPIFFPGGNIGTLAVNGTVNDLAVGGAIPLYMSCAFIMEEGFPISQLKEIAESMKQAADLAGVQLVTGDTKVVGKNACDKIFINTSGIGVIPQSVRASSSALKAGDKILVSGSIGEHGACIMAARNDLNIDASIESDCRPLNHLVFDLLAAGCEIRAMRDATRGGVAAVLNEFACASNLCLRINEKSLEIKDEVRGLCEILGLDPLYLANEGTMLVVVSQSSTELALKTMHMRSEGARAALIGEVLAEPLSTVILRTSFGGERLIDMPLGEQLPRIC